MDFFERQDQARRNTKLLVVYFVLGVALLIVAVYAATLVIFTGVASRHHHAYDEQVQFALWNPQLFFGAALGTLAVIALGSGFKTLELAQGGSTVATMLGGRLVDPSTTDPDERKLRNVVEEMAIAAGVPVPQVYLLPQEQAINAFAAGHSTSDAVVAVTAGAVKLLTRDELQGVIGHEFSHILNGDMRLNLRLMGVVYGILVLAIVGYYIMRTAGSFSRGSEKNGGGTVVLLLGVALLIFGYLGVFFGRLIQSAINRQREFLADASSVQFTRQPAGITGALKKIGGLSEGSHIRDSHAQEVSHMFFGDAFCNSFFNLFATHPPLADRIRAIDPSFDGAFPEVSPVSAGREDVAKEFGRAHPAASAAVMGLAGTAVGATVVSPMAPPMVAAEVVSTEAAEACPVSSAVADVPQALLNAAREPFAAPAIIYLLLLSRDNESLRAKQWEMLRGRVEPPLFQQAQRMNDAAQALPVAARLSLVDLTIPALKRSSAQQYARFRQTVDSLVNAAGRVDLFEYSLCTVLFSYLDVHFGLKKPAAARYRTVSAVADPLLTVLSMLAYVGQTDEASATRAFQAGVGCFHGKAAMVPLSECTLKKFDAALAELAQTTPLVKRDIMAAVTACIMAGSRVTPHEQELLRVISAALSCPMPPIALKNGRAVKCTTEARRPRSGNGRKSITQRREGRKNKDSQTSFFVEVSQPLGGCREPISPARAVSSGSSGSSRASTLVCVGSHRYLCILSPVSVPGPVLGCVRAAPPSYVSTPGSVLGCVRAGPSLHVPGSSSASGLTCSRVLLAIAHVPQQNMPKPGLPRGIGIGVTAYRAGVRTGVHGVIHGADVA